MRSLFQTVRLGGFGGFWGSRLGSVAVAAGLVLAGAQTAAAEEVVLEAPPTLEQVQAAPAQTTTVTTTTTQAVAAPPAAPLAPAYPQQPVYPAQPGYQGYPAQPLPPGAQGPMYFNGPVYVVPAPVTGQPVQAWPRQRTYVPRYRYRARTASCCALPPRTGLPAYTQARYVNVQRGPVFSMGLRFTTMGINQEVFGEKLNMMGGGLQLRFRNQGHWGFETGFDILRANIKNDAFIRTSYPWTAGVMLYLFKNRPQTHFNLYAVAGLGLVADDVILYRETPQERRQQYLEVLAQAGGGAELRFNRLAFSADIRAVGLALDGASPAGQFYEDVESGPIPQSSIGYKANFTAMLAF